MSLHRWMDESSSPNLKSQPDQTWWHHVENKICPEQWVHEETPNSYPWSWVSFQGDISAASYQLSNQIQFDKADFPRMWGKPVWNDIYIPRMMLNTLKFADSIIHFLQKCRPVYTYNIDPLIHDSVIFMLRLRPSFFLSWFWINVPWTCPSCFETPAGNWWMIYCHYQGWVFFLPSHYHNIWHQLKFS